MKLYEGAESERRFTPTLPVIARVDGRAFHSFTRGLNRPFDESFSECMIETARYLAQETNACIAYTQSDEITLAWHSEDAKSQIWFDGRVMKMTSQLAAHATLAFNMKVLDLMPGMAEKMPTFDARVWTVPNRTEGANVFVWREWDATKNSISMLAQSHFRHSQLHGKNGSDKQDMLMSIGVNWNDTPTRFKRGTYIQRRIISKPFTAEEIENLPIRHAARANPSLTVERSEWREIELPIITKIKNREAVVFEGHEPVMHDTARECQMA